MKIWSIILFLLISSSILAQRSYRATRISTEIKIDGQLDDEAWSTANLAEGFTTNYPVAGKNSRYSTTVRMLYDDQALYISATMLDPEPDSIMYVLSQRDDFGNADWFGVQLDPYGRNQNGFGFYVTSAGVELDALLAVDPDDDDFSWNAVWKSRVAKIEGGWQVEMRIPFSAIRFPNKEEQTWNINFNRQVRRNREMSFWNPVDPFIVGEITQMAKVEDVRAIESPLRLSFIPYVAGYMENVSDPKNNINLNTQRLAGGLDLKYGINDAFTYDMTLIPDFGQTVSDQKVLNLSPFEVRFDENRPFFIEGTDLFQIGGQFYSRRIGGTPFYRDAIYGELGSGESVASNPQTASLLNATKISGRTKGGLGVGFFNAIENEMYATIENQTGEKREVLTNPYTNYNVLVFSQNLNNNSSVSFVNTNTTRNGSARDANVSIAEMDFFSKNRKYKIWSGLQVSTINQNGELITGHAHSFWIGKVQGEWNYSIMYYEESDTYDPNDLGYLQSNNARGMEIELKKNRFSPKGNFLRKWNNLNVYYEQLYSTGQFAQLAVSGSSAGTLRNFLTVGVNGSVDPIGYVNHFESRTAGRPVNFDPSYSIGGFYSSDYSKKFALDLRGSFKQFTNWEQLGGNLTFSPRIRLSSRVFIVWNTTVEYYHHDYGYVQNLQPDDFDAIILGTRNREVITNSIKGEFIFTNRMGVDLRFRHYWQNVAYLNFHTLNDEGWRNETTYNPKNDNEESLHNTSYNAFTVDMNYRWVFIPGSELRIAWKYNIFNAQNKLDTSYFTTFNTLFQEPQFNSVSVKLLMYIDALMFKRKHKVNE